MVSLLLSVVIFYILWQLSSRLRKNAQDSSEIKTEFQSAIDDAKARLPRTGLFSLFQGEPRIPETVERPISAAVELEPTGATRVEAPLRDKNSVADISLTRETTSEISSGVSDFEVEDQSDEVPLAKQFLIAEPDSIDDSIVKEVFEVKLTDPWPKAKSPGSEEVSCLTDDDEVPLEECEEEYPHAGTDEDLVEDQATETSEAEVHEDETY